MSTTVHILINAAIYGDCQVTPEVEPIKSYSDILTRNPNPQQQQNNTSSIMIGTKCQERLCLVSRSFLNCLPLRISSPNSVGRFSKPHFDLFMSSGTFPKFAISLRFQLAPSNYNHFSHYSPLVMSGGARRTTTTSG